MSFTDHVNAWRTKVEANQGTQLCLSEIMDDDEPLTTTGLS
jgi:hypothetical protein